MTWDDAFAKLAASGWVGQQIHFLASESRRFHAQLRSGESACLKARRRLEAIAGLDPDQLSDVTDADERAAWDIVQRRVVKLYRWRRGLAAKAGRAPLFDVSAPRTIIEEVSRQLEVDQVIHCMALRLNSDDPPAERLAGSIYTGAREAVFQSDAGTLARFASGVLECDKIATEACSEAMAYAALALAQHTAGYPHCHGALQRALKRLASMNPRLWLVDLRFEDFLANHRLVKRGQILGTYTAVDETGHVRFEPPLEDEDLTARLRARFNLETAQAFLSKQRPPAALDARPAKVSIAHAQGRTR